MTSAILASLTILLYGVSTVRSDIPLGYRDPSLNLLPNNGFEDTPAVNFHGCNRAECDEITSDCHEGKKCILVRNRTNRFAGPMGMITDQKHLDLISGKPIYLSAWLKTPMDPIDKMFYMMRIWVGYKAVNDSLQTNTNVGREPNLRGNETFWWHLAGDFRMPDVQLEYVKIFFELDIRTDAHLEYLIDDMSIIVIPNKDNWREEANADIVRYRKNDVRITGQLPANVKSCLVEVRINQTKNHFGFGLGTQADRYSENTDFGVTLRNWHKSNFNWIVLMNSMKPKPMEPVEGHPNYGRVDRSIEFAKKDNLTMRAHALLWNSESHNPDYMRNKSREDTVIAMRNRTTNLVRRYRYDVQQWDAVNEWLHGQFYENRTGNPNIQQEVFQWARAVDPNINLCSNDYQGLRLGDYTASFVQQIKRLDATHAFVNCLGVQSHLRVRVLPDILSWRLNVLATAGKPIFVTELSIHQKNETIRAQQLNETLHLVFSNPSVSGFLFWGAINHTRLAFEPNETLLFEDFDKPTMAGQVYLDLHKKWHTNTYFRPLSSIMDETLSMFHGAYTIETLYNGISAQNYSTYIHPGGKSDINLSWQEDDFVVSPDDICPTTTTKPPTTTTTTTTSKPTTTTSATTTSKPTTTTSATTTTEPTTTSETPTTSSRTTSSSTSTSTTSTITTTPTTTSTTTTKPPTTTTTTTTSKPTTTTSATTTTKPTTTTSATTTSKPTTTTSATTTSETPTTSSRTTSSSTSTSTTSTITTTPTTTSTTTTTPETTTTTTAPTTTKTTKGPTTTITTTNPKTSTTSSLTTSPTSTTTTTTTTSSPTTTTTTTTTATATTTTSSFTTVVTTPTEKTTTVTTTSTTRTPLTTRKPKGKGKGKGKEKAKGKAKGHDNKLKKLTQNIYLVQ